FGRSSKRIKLMTEDPGESPDEDEDDRRVRKLNFIILEDKDSLEEDLNDTKVVINPGESEEETNNDLDIWLEKMLEEPQGRDYWPSCKRDFPRGCGDSSRTRSRRFKAKRAKGQHKSRTNARSNWCGPCAKKHRAWCMKAKRMGARVVEDGWKMRVCNCCGPPNGCGWTNMAEGQITEWRASGHDAHNWATSGDDVPWAWGKRGSALGYAVGDWHAGGSLGLAGLGMASAQQHAREKVGRDGACEMTRGCGAGTCILSRAFIGEAQGGEDPDRAGVG
ncbi:Unknown protein, partial [Striga hermonthica]